ncbi:hypothetical protein ACHHYP_15018 [Achlya hypogyna]|uniref:Uncharacterized protein n=1 Tax=Achlya hypogyna TaxID=1202772 RepID=A0A1V9YBR5_ACHHY|nr:hypothetical protein ACHHYP_15018 [Achlya hypogyna]
MQLTLAVNGLTFTVACGEGHQCIKWLGLVAAQRYSLMLPHGRCRTREDAHARQGFYLPSEVRNSDGLLLGPWSRISDCCRENETISVHLQHEVPVDEIGVPVMTEWAISAFSNASNQQTDLEPDDHVDNGMAASKDLEPLDAQSEINGYAKAHQSTHVRSGQFISQEEIEAAFYHDLPYLKLDEFVKDTKDREDAEETLLKYYDCVNTIYKHYSIGFGDDMYSMTFLEFVHFAHESSMLHFQKDINILDKIFHTVVGILDTDGTLPRVGFIQAVLRVIMTYNKMYGDDIPLLAALEKGLHDAVKPAVLRITTGPFRDTVHSDSILALFQDAKPKLTKVYEKYATATSDKIPGTFLNASGLRSLIQDSGIFCTGDSDEHESLFAQAIAQSFSGIKECNNAESQWFVFVEFLEIVSRLSLGIWQDKDVSAKETIRIGLDAVRALAKSK